MSNRSVSFVSRVADLFRSRPNTWIPGMTIAEVGGCYAWRTRLSDCRKLGLDIRNRQRRVKRADGSHYVVSEYMLMKVSAITMKTGEEVATGAETPVATV